MTEERLAGWIAAIFETNPDEIDCNRLQALLPAYVERELDLVFHSFSDEQRAAVQTHLRHCPDCREEYLALRHLLTLETEEGLPEAEALLAQLEDAGKTDPVRVMAATGARS